MANNKYKEHTENCMKYKSNNNYSLYTVQYNAQYIRCYCLANNLYYIQDWYTRSIEHRCNVYVYKYGIIKIIAFVFCLLCVKHDKSYKNHKRFLTTFLLFNQVFGHLIQNHQNQFVKKFNAKLITIKEYLNHLHHQYGRLEVLDHHQSLKEKNFDKFRLNLQLLVEKIINR